jgi:hypothetical protein
VEKMTDDDVAEEEEEDMVSSAPSSPLHEPYIPDESGSLELTMIRSWPMSRPGSPREPNTTRK